MVTEAKKIKLTLTVNGKPQEVEAYPMARLLDVLREEVGLTGTKEGCGEGECGACSVLVQGELVNSCLIPFAQADGVEITTIEGLQIGDRLSVLQEAFMRCNGAQCGICTPGMILAAQRLLNENTRPTDDDIKFALAGNLCRCTGYTRIFQAVREAAATIRGGA